MPALVYWFGGLAIARGSDAITLGTLVAFTTLQTRLFFPIGSLLGVSVDVQSSLALFDRVFEYLDLHGRHRGGDARRCRGRSPATSRSSDVWFRYDEAAWTLEGVAFEVPAGTTTALVGETGSGKTTLGYLVARLYDATQGRVTIDGVDVRDLTFDSLADAVGVVSQETYLFHATVRENLRFAKPDATRRGDRGGRGGGADPRADLDAARGLRHRRRRARLPLLGRREAADRDRAHDPAQPADPRARRGDLVARHADRAARCRRRSSGSRRAGRRSRSRTGSRRSATPTRSSCSTAAASSRSARTTSCSRAAAATPRCVARDADELRLLRSRAETHRTPAHFQCSPGTARLAASA